MTTNSYLFVFICFLCFGTYAHASTDTCVARATYVDPDSGVQVTVKGNSLEFEGGRLFTPFFNVSGNDVYTLPLQTQNVLSVETNVFCYDQGAYYLVIASQSSREKLTILKPFPKSPGEECKHKASEYLNDQYFLYHGDVVPGTEDFCAYSIVAIFVAASGSFCSTLGLNLQKLTHDRMKKEGDHDANPFTKPLWLLGLFFIVFDAAVLDTVTFGLASASLLAPLASLVLVWNIMLAPVMLGEALDKPGLVATFVIITGTVLASIAAPHSSPVFNPEYFAARFGSPEVIVYLTIVGVTLTLGWYTIERIRISNTTLEPCVTSLDESVGEDLGKVLNVAADSAYLGDVEDRDSEDTWGSICNTDEKHIADARSSSAAESFEKLNLPESSFNYKLIRFGYGSLSGLLGGQSVLFAKLVIELLKTSIFGKSQNIEYMCFADYRFYIYLAIMISVLVLQMKILNIGLKHFDSLIIIPLMITFYNVFGIIGGGVYYQDFQDFQTMNFIMFPCGVVVSFFGIYLLATTSGKNKSESSNDELDSRRSIFRLSVSIPLMNADEMASPRVRLSRRSISSDVRSSMRNPAAAVNTKAIGVELAGENETKL